MTEIANIIHCPRCNKRHNYHNACEYEPIDEKELFRTLCQSQNKIIKELQEEIDKLKEGHDWYCGCGHWNGANLAVCALCGRTPGESR